MLTEEEYYDFYHKYGKTIDQINISKPLNDKQLWSKYLKYVKKEERKKDNKIAKVKEGDPKWEQTKKDAFNYYGKKCLLLSKLTEEELYQVKLLLYGEFTTVDPAHILPKSVYPKFKYNHYNVIPLSRLFHSRLDSYKDPITGKNISKEEHEIWWNRIIYPNTIENMKELYLEGV